ncbi:MAG: pyridoxal-phosphate dependent enzyme [Spirochaetota bacterium]
MANNIWRYWECYGLPPGDISEGRFNGHASDSAYRTKADSEKAFPVTMGEGCTPLVKRSVDQIPVLFKLDFLNPSGSFKDRGASVLVSYAKYIGIRRMVEDSSGNAGAAISAYSASAGISCTVFVPEYTPEEKTVQMSMYGAEVVRVPGKRQDASNEALKAAEGYFYASHLWHPFFINGLMSTAFELWEDTGGKIPEAIILPLGSGGNLEGLFKGFKLLKNSGYIKKVPKLIGVQSEGCKPIHIAFSSGMDNYAEVGVERSIAEGIAVQRPPRARAVLKALRESEGFTVVVKDDEIIKALKRLAEMGFYVEPTSAVTLAAWHKLDRALKKNAVLILTGNGLKATATYSRLLESSRQRSLFP